VVRRLERGEEKWLVGKSGAGLRRIKKITSFGLRRTEVAEEVGWRLRERDNGGNRNAVSSAIFLIDRKDSQIVISITGVSAARDAKKGKNGDLFSAQGASTNQG